MTLDPALYPWWQEDGPDEEETMSETPSYYRTGPDSDLFDVFVYRYGLETVQAHLEMAAIEYVYRAGLKGQYHSDLRKIGPLVERLLQWKTSTPPLPPPWTPPCACWDSTATV